MKYITTLLLISSAVYSYCQGTVNIQNRNATITPAINAPISYAPPPPTYSGYPRGDTVPTKVDGAGSLVFGAYDFGGRYAMAGLYGGPVGTPEDQLLLLVPAVGFRSGAAAGYLNVGSSASRAFPSTGYWAVAPGAQAVVQIRAWDAGVYVNSYEDALGVVSGTHGVYYGKSALMTITTGGAGQPPGPAADLIGLASFSMYFSVIPEPSFSALSLLGVLSSLIFFRWRR